jgi:hypothetical protein
MLAPTKSRLLLTSTAVLAVSALLGLLSAGAAETADPTQTLSPEELVDDQFDDPVEWQDPEVAELSLGQQFILGGQRNEVENLLGRHVGVSRLEGNEADLDVLQQLVTKGVLAKDDVRDWQAVGVVFGDILANELGLAWVSYEDERGVSKALRWRKTMNFVFPITLFSKRNQFNQSIDMHAIYAKLVKDVEAFRAPFHLR